MIITEEMVEAAAIALFDDDEDRNDEFIAKMDRLGKTEIGDRIGRKRETWAKYDDGRSGLQDAFRRRARAALDAAAKVADIRNEVRADGGCLHCAADQGENHRPDCARPRPSHV
ncbi:MAG: hypothetical protein BGN87_00310 [Rhizobiales bacterium 65-79]|nr:hypothetical protein [Hyphomicrobiales bacterium]OJU02626.1 MAG: hypothetical protein BGN87_00310 [Rhizobiales bacterium 65-79]